HIELMWRERFGLGLDPLARLLKLLDEPEEWVSEEGDLNLYHRRFPEFTIVEGRMLIEHFAQSWSKKFPDPDAHSYYVECRYHATVLKRCVFVSCDGGRYHVPVPNRLDDDHFELDKSSLEYKIALLYGRYGPREDDLARVGLVVR